MYVWHVFFLPLSGNVLNWRRMKMCKDEQQKNNIKIEIKKVSRTIQILASDVQWKCYVPGNFQNWFFFFLSLSLRCFLCALQIKICANKNERLTIFFGHCYWDGCCLVRAKREKFTKWYIKLEALIQKPTWFQPKATRRTSCFMIRAKAL